jgi:hypothetical protein
MVHLLHSATTKATSIFFACVITIILFLISEILKIMDIPKLYEWLSGLTPPNYVAGLAVLAGLMVLDYIFARIALGKARRLGTVNKRKDKVEWNSKSIREMTFVKLCLYVGIMALGFGVYSMQMGPWIMTLGMIACWSAEARSLRENYEEITGKPIPAIIKPFFTAIEKIVGNIKPPEGK